jgi:DNA helicase-2/ATP-dependent DNA helicase PcrA
MDALLLTRARYRRRYGNDMPEPSVASRFLEEVPAHLMDDLSGSQSRASAYGNFSGHNSGYGGGYGSGYARRRPNAGSEDAGDRHYSYEDEDQSAASSPNKSAPANRFAGARKPPAGGGSLDNIAHFFGNRGAAAKRPKLDIPEPTGQKGLKSQSRVRHPKYGEGIVLRREGDGDDAKVTVQFTRFGVKKLVEKFAQLERL